MMRLRILAGLLLASALGAEAGAAQAAAAPTDAPDLPPLAQVMRALQDSPVVRAAGAQLEVQEANSRKLDAGPHEWTLRMLQQRREVRTTPQGRLNEWEVNIERGLRLPGKQELDRKLGDAGVATARVSRGDALHETSRMLLEAWFGWLRERETAAQWQQQVSLLARHAAAIHRRVELGDAPRLEATLADGALAQAQAQAGLAAARTDVAAESLLRRYPAISLPAQVSPAEPAVLEGSRDDWIEAVLAHNHELGVARSEAQRARLGARRADAERLPDPSVGVRMANERAGEERIVGLILSVPLPGEGRHASADMATAEAEAASFLEAGTLQKVRADAAALHRRTTGAYDSWQRNRTAAEALTRAAEMSERAWQLGEGSLSEVLTARRLANEASLSARLAQLDAQEARYRLLLDSHRLWPLDMDDEHDHDQHDHP
ncbi:MAG: TolC family protein [Zoogloea sp.]|nr:TolC family protein [Zoogloea sp.]